MQQIENYISYLSGVRRYSERTVGIYRDCLEEFVRFGGEDLSASLTPAGVRGYEIHLIDERRLGPATVSLHLSVLSGFSAYLIRAGLLSSNPVRLVKRPRQPKRLPTFYRESSMKEYFRTRSAALEFGDYPDALRYMTVSLLYSTGLRRAELISLNRSSVDRGRKVLRVIGKGDKMREIPLTDAALAELDLFRAAADRTFPDVAAEEDVPLLLTPSGERLYPVFVDRIIKKELGGVDGITVRKSPHVLRHTIASELLDSGADLNSIKELLGHSSLAATQIYTHSTIEKLKKVYADAHPRAHADDSGED